MDNTLTKRSTGGSGFLVHNDRAYPNLVRLFGELGVATNDSQRRWGDVSGVNRTHYCGAHWRDSGLFVGTLRHKRVLMRL